MRVPRPLLSVLTAVLLAASVSAQSASTAPTTSDPQAVALLQKSLAALTGGATVTDVTLIGSARRIAGSDDETGSATLEATSAGDSRVELDFASGSRIEIRNHSALPLPGSLPQGVSASVAQAPQPLGEWIGPDGVPHAMTSHNIMTNAAWFFPVLTLQEIVLAQNYALRYIGQETRNGQTVIHISASESFANLPKLANANPKAPPPTPAQFQSLMQHLSEMDFYLDPNSLLPVAVAFSQHPDGNALVDIAVEIRFSSYQAVSGVAVPMNVQKYMNNGLVLDLQFSNATLNTGLAASAFAIE